MAEVTVKLDPDAVQRCIDTMAKAKLKATVHICLCVFSCVAVICIAVVKVAS